MNRRRFLSRLAVSAAALPLVEVNAASAPSAAGRAGADAFIDTNVWLGSWPTRQAWSRTPAQLVAKLRSHGVTSAWAGSFEAALHSDVAGTNARLAEACAQEGAGVLVPFGAINPILPDWEEDLRRCHEVHRMPGVRLLPNYHGYELGDARFGRLLDLAVQRGLLVQIALTIEDDRSQNPAFAAAPVQPAPLVNALERQPKARVMLLNATSRLLGANTVLLQRLTALGASCEIATLESVAGIETLLQKVPAARLAFGSHAPYFYFEAALLKLRESALTPAQLADVRHGHATAALARS